MVAATPKLLSKEEFFAGAERKLKYAHVPQMGGSIPYMPMSMTERRQIRKACSITEVNELTGEASQILDMEKFEVNALVYCCRDSKDPNKLMFTTDDIAMLESKLSSGFISAVSTEIMKESGLSPNAVKSSEKGTESK